MPLIDYTLSGKTKKVRATFYVDGRPVPKAKALEMTPDHILFVENTDQLLGLTSSSLRGKVVAVVSAAEWSRRK